MKGTSFSLDSGSPLQNDFEGLMEGSATVADVQKCISKTINYDENDDIQKVSIKNFKLLNLVCVILLLVSCTVLVLEKIFKKDCKRKFSRKLQTQRSTWSPEISIESVY